MKIILLLICSLFVGCSNVPKKEIEYRTVAHKELVYCTSDVPLVHYESLNIKKDDKVQEKVRKLLIDRQQRIQVEEKLRAELKGCTKE